jgi:methionyl-tRNA formyltransferase
MQMDAGLDTGAVFARETLAIGDNETAGELHDRLALLGGEMLTGQLTSILAGTLTPVPQNAAEVTYASKIRTADARMDWTRPAQDLQRLVRAYNPVPGARFDYGDEMVKCWGAEIAADQGGSPGKILSADKRGIVVGCGEGGLRLTELQRPGRRRVSAAEFAAQLNNTSSFNG